MDDYNHDHPGSGDRCVICQRFFHRTRKGQKTCGEAACRKRRKREQEKAWLVRWREKYKKSYFSGDYERIRDWRKANPDYQRRWRDKRRREIHNAMPPAEPIKPILLRLRIPSALRLSEIQTLTLRLSRSRSGFQVDGVP